MNIYTPNDFQKISGQMPDYVLDDIQKSRQAIDKKNDFRFWLSVIISVIALVVAIISLNIQIGEKQQKSKTIQTEKPKSVNTYSQHNRK